MNRERQDDEGRHSLWRARNANPGCERGLPRPLLPIGGKSILRHIMKALSSRCSIARPPELSEAGRDRLDAVNRSFSSLLA